MAIAPLAHIENDGPKHRAARSTTIDLLGCGPTVPCPARQSGLRTSTAASFTSKHNSTMADGDEAQLDAHLGPKEHGDLSQQSAWTWGSSLWAYTHSARLAGHGRECSVGEI